MVASWPLLRASLTRCSGMIGKHVVIPRALQVLMQGNLREGSAKWLAVIRPCSKEGLMILLLVWTMLCHDPSAQLETQRVICAALASDHSPSAIGLPRSNVASS